jgi:hypothetical protein
MQIGRIEVFDLLTGVKNTDTSYPSESFAQGSGGVENATLRNTFPDYGEYLLTYVTVHSNLPPAT